MSINKYQSLCFNDKHLTDLSAIKDDNNFFIFVEEIVDRILEDTRPDEFKSERTTQQANKINRELDILRVALNGLSDEAHSIVRCGLLGYEEYIFGDRNVDPVNDMLIVVTENKETKSLNPRQQIGMSAYNALRVFHINAESSRGGDFTKVISVILDACHLNHDANKLARDTLENL